MIRTRPNTQVAALEASAQLLWLSAPKYVPFIWGGPLGKTNSCHNHCDTIEDSEEGGSRLGQVTPRHKSYFPTRRDEKDASVMRVEPTTLNPFDRACLARSLNEQHCCSEVDDAAVSLDGRSPRAQRKGLDRRSGPNSGSMSDNAIESSRSSSGRSRSCSTAKLKTTEVASGDEGCDSNLIEEGATARVTTWRIGLEAKEVSTSILPALTPKANVVVLAGRFAMVAFWVILAASGNLNQPLF